MMEEGTGSLGRRTFTRLPKYGKDENGVYRIQYSLEEMSYEASDGEGTYTYNTASGYNTTDEDKQYEAFYPHDAGEESPDDDDYYIVVNNHKRNTTNKQYIDIDLNKIWADHQDDDNAWAEFQLMRYKRTEYRDISRASDEDLATPVMVTLQGSNGVRISEIEIPRNTSFHVAATFLPHTEEKSVNIRVSQEGEVDQNITLTSSAGNAGNEIVRSLVFYPMNNITVTILDGEENLDGGSYGVQLLNTLGQATEAVPDTSYQGDVIRLSKENGWENRITVLQQETSSGDDNNQENITIYGYYFVETRSNPTGYAADFYAHGSWTGDTGTEAGTAAQRIYSSGSSIDAVNEEAPQLVVKKRWRGVPDTTGYPEIKFQLWCGYREGNVVTVNSNQTWPYKNQNGEIYEITLNEDNDWTWVCPEDLPAKGASPDNQTYFTDVGYFVKEILPDQNDRTIGGTTWNFYQYVNDKGNAYNSVNQGGKAGIVANDKGNIEGTITIVNAVNDYFQMDIKKQFFMIHDDGAWDNVTAQTGMKDTVLGFRVLRRIVFPDNSKSGWMDYGDEMFVGFDHDGHTVMDNGSNDFYLEYGGSDWHFRIRDESHLTDTGDLSGLPKRGYYVNDAGETIGVKYEYCYRETGVYKDLNKTPYPDWEWYSTITPDRYISENGQTGEFGIAFPNQDGERVANYQASNILINKRWAGEPNAREVYINIYRKAGANGEAEDFTKIIADDVAGRYPENHPAYGNSNWQHYVDDTSIVDTTKNYLILKSNSSGDWTTTVNIYNALIGEAGENTGSHYTYWIQEIGYKDKNGTVHMLSETDDLDELETHYNHWVNGVFGAWIERGDPNWLDNAIRINEKDTNKLLTVNVPEMNMTVNKEWFDINGDPTEPWQDKITFQIEQGTALIKIDGDDTFTIYKDYGTNRDINVNHNAHDQYTTEGDVQTYGAPWTFYIDGLQEGYFDDNHDEWHCTYNIKEVNVIKSEVTILGSHSISEVKLMDAVLHVIKEQIATVMRMKKLLEMAQSLPENQRNIFNYDAQIVKLQEEIERNKGFRMKLYESLEEGMIDKDEYFVFKKNYSDKISLAEKNIQALEAERDAVVEKNAADYTWVDAFKKYEGIEQVERQVVVNLISEIRVYEGNVVEIDFQHNDAIEAALKVIETMPEDMKTEA